MRMSRFWWVVVGLVPVLLMLLHATDAVPVVVPLTKDETSLCIKTDPPTVCQMKVAQCAPLTSLLAPLIGTPVDIISCANTTGITLKDDFIEGIGKAMLLGDSKKLAKKPTGEPAANLAIRQCILKASGLLGTNFMLDRTAVASRVSLLSPPSLAAAVASATTTCPVPLDLSSKPFMKCLMTACIAGATMPAMAAPGAA